MAKLHITIIGHRQSGNERTAILTCSCGLKYEANLRKENLKEAKTNLQTLHTKVPTEPLEPPKPKKLKLGDSTNVTELTTGSTITPNYEGDITVESESNDYGDDDFATPPSTNEPENED